MSSSSTVTGPRGRSPPKRSISGMGLSWWDGNRDGRGTGTHESQRGRFPRTVPVVALVADLVQELVHSLTDSLEPIGLCHRHIRVGDVPAFCRDLVAGKVVFRLRAANPRPAFECTIHEIQVVGNLRREVVDIRIPLSVEGRAEEQLRIVL